MLRNQMHRLPLVAAAVAGGVVLALNACGIGEGIKIERISIVPLADTGVTTIATTKIFRCVRDGLRAFGTFSDGEVGEYTTRVHWSSSNTNVVTISNGDQFVPGSTTLVLAAGTLSPIAPGTAIVSADYVGLHEEIQVTVDNLEDAAITITPANPRLAPGSLDSLHATALLDGRLADITSTATWSFVAPDDSIATIDSATGIVTAVTSGGPLTAQASFNVCTAVPHTTVQVKPIESLEVRREFDPPLTELVVGTSELLKVIAHFANDDGSPDSVTQDLSNQTTFTSSDAAVISFVASAGQTSEMLALGAGGPVGIAGVFAPTGYQPVAALPAFEISTVSAALNSIAITPENPTIAPFATQQFHAIGSYDNGTRTQDITRHVSWTTSDATVAVINNVTSLAGLAVSLQGTAGSVTITASNSIATVTPTVTTTLTITPASP